MRIRGFARPSSRVLIVVAEDAAMTAARWMLAGPDRRVIQRGRAGTKAPGATPWPVKIDRTVLIVHGGAVVARRPALSPGRSAQMRASALYRLGEEGLAGPADGLHLALGAPDAEGRRLAAAVDRSALDGWLAQAATMGLAPDAILPDSLCPPSPEGEGWTRVALFDRVVLRGPDQAVSLEPELADLVTAGASVRALDDPEQIEAMLVAAAFDPPVNLLDGLKRGAAGAEARRWRIPAILAAALALSPLALMAAEAVRFELLAGELDRRSAAVVKRIWPDVPPGADAAAEARARLGPSGAGGFTGDVAALFTAMEQMEGVKVQMLSLEDDGALRVSVAHPDPADMAHLNTALEPFGLTLSEEGLGEEDGRVLSDIRVTRR